MNSLLEALLNRLRGISLTPSQGTENPLMPNANLETQVSPTAYPVNPLALAMAQHSGVLNFIRNAKNKREADVQDVIQ